MKFFLFLKMYLLIYPVSIYLPICLSIYGYGCPIVLTLFVRRPSFLQRVVFTLCSEVIRTYLFEFISGFFTQFH